MPSKPRGKHRLVLRDPPAEHEPVLVRLHAAMLQHPVATQAIVSALVAEGRRFAETPEGRRWSARLARSELVRRGQILWEGSGLALFDDDAGAVLPSALLDCALGALAGADVMGLLDRLWQSTHEVRDAAPRLP